MRCQTARRGSRLRSRLRAACLSLLLASGCGGGPEDTVLVVVNGESPVSRAIGEYYLERRGIPRENLVTLDIPLSDPALGDASAQSISRAGYQTLVRDPIATFLSENELRERIEIIVLAKGIPLRVEGAEVPRALWLRDSTTASVDAELALLFSDRDGSAGVADAVNPYFDSDQSFADFRRQNPGSPLHYLVARLTGYQSEVDPETGVPRDVKALIDRAQAEDPASGSEADESHTRVWLIDEDPSLPPDRAAANTVLLTPTAAVLRALGLRVIHETTELFAGDVQDIAGYASWGSNDLNSPGQPT